MRDQELLKSFYLQEKESRCYDICIKGIPLYFFIRRDIRTDYFIDNGINSYEKRSIESKYNRLFSIIQSFFHLITRSSRKSSILYHTFRVENIGGKWMDRFFDPIIEIGGGNKDYTIIETNNGRCRSPRLHRDKIMYDDFSVFLATISSFLFYWIFVKIRYRKEFISLDKSILFLRPLLKAKDVKLYNRKIIAAYLRVLYYKRLLLKKNIRCVVSASRSSFLSLMCAAKMMNIRVVELQHGLIYGESVTYGGYNHPLFTPDKFFTFGEFEPRNVYGIEESNVVTTGWGLREYLDRMEIDSDISQDDILVLSQNLTTDYMIKCTVSLAKNNPTRRFFFRCHPLEKLSDEQQQQLNNQNNIFIQELNETFLLAIKPFSIVIGDDQTTAIYEASAYGKKVGILALDNKEVLFLNDEAAKCFWLIKDDVSFKEFLDSDVKTKPSYNLYSTFNKALFNDIVDC